MLNYYPLDINFGSLTQTVINVETNSFQRPRKCTRDRHCVGRVWICNECFVKLCFSLQLFILVSFFLFLNGIFSFWAQSSLFSDWSWGHCESLLFTLTLFSNLCLPSNTLPDNPHKTTFRRRKHKKQKC